MLKHDLDELYQCYGNDIFRYLYVLTKDVALSEELTQETFYQAVKSCSRYRGDASLYTWLCAIAKHCYFSHRKKNQRYLYVEDACFDALLQAKKPSSETYDALYVAISCLSSPYREIVQLHIYDGLTLIEISQLMGKSESFARVAYHRAKQMLRKEMTSHEL